MEYVNLPQRCIDKITAIEPGKSLRAERYVKPDLSCFKDHFTGFAVLPGVLMLEGMVQAASWLVRQTEDFKHSQVRMVKCSPAKFSRLVRPEQTIEFVSDLTTAEPPLYNFKAKVFEGGKTVASARFTICSGEVGESSRPHAHVETPLNTKYKAIFESLCALC